ncbi:MAG TPA: DUF3298 domain-containing protein [Oculatellaceae cyanobacterium]
MATKTKPKPNPIIDFRELAAYQSGNGLEALVRMVGERLGFAPEWTGIGTDGGRDLTFTDVQRGRLAQDSVKWLVSCKDHAESGTNVSESDVECSVIDKAAQHGCAGFLLATTTNVTSGLKANLDGLNAHNKLKTTVWDVHELTAQILKRKNRDLFQQFFPESFRRYSEGKQKTKEDLAHYKQLVESKFGLPPYESIEGAEYASVKIVDDQIPGYSVELEFPQFVDNGVSGISEVNLIVRARMLDQLHKLRAERLLSSRDIRLDAKEHWEAVRDSVKKYLAKEELGVLPSTGDEEENSADLDLSNWNSALVVDYEIILLTDKLVSIRFSYYHNSASAAHPNHWTEVFNYQFNPAIPLSLDTVFAENASFLTPLSELCIRAITRQKIGDAEWTAEVDLEDRQIFADDLPATVSEAADEWSKSGVTPENLRKFCLTKEGFVFIFDEYAVADYAAGMFQVRIRYSALREWINPKCSVIDLAR